MKRYFSTFFTGFAGPVLKWLSLSLGDIDLLRSEDGLVLYETRASWDEVSKLSFLNNSYALLRIYEGVRDPVDMIRRSLSDGRLLDALSRILRGDRRARKVRTFRVMASFENRLTRLPEELRGLVESKVKARTRLVVDRSMPDGELLYLARREGFGVLGLRITRRGQYERILRKGELYPELAEILCRLSEPIGDDVFLDPLAGSGAIILARARFPVQRLIAGDVDSETVSIIRRRCRERNIPIGVHQWDARKLAPIESHSVDKIVTDPPWTTRGLGEGVQLHGFYTELAKEFRRVIRPSGMLVVLTGEPDVMALALSSTAWHGVSRFDTLVSGRKASVLIARPRLFSLDASLRSA